MSMFAKKERYYRYTWKSYKRNKPRNTLQYVRDIRMVKFFSRLFVVLKINKS